MNPYIVKANKLLELARKQFGDLTPAEEKLFRAVVDPDQVADYADYSALSPLLRPGVSGNAFIYARNQSERSALLRNNITEEVAKAVVARAEEANDPANSANWPDERRLEASRISWLCTDREAPKLVSHNGIRIFGASIDGRFDLEDVSVVFPIGIRMSSIPGGIHISHAHVRSLDFSGTHTGGLDASGASIDSHAFLRNGFRCNGLLDLRRASIRTDLDLNAALLLNEKGPALGADGIAVAGSVLMSERFCVEGEVRLLASCIGGDLVCSGAKFLNESSYRGERKGEPVKAFSADGLSVKGSVYMDRDLQAKGEVRFVGGSIGGSLYCNNGVFGAGLVLMDASIGGVLSCKGSRLILEGDSNIALNADRVTVKADVFMHAGFEAKGEVRFLGASIGGDVALRGAKLRAHGTNRKAFCADGISVKGNVFMDGGFEARGGVRLAAACIGGNVTCRSGLFCNRSEDDCGGAQSNREAFNGGGMNVKGSVFMDGDPQHKRPCFMSKGKVNLTGASIGGDLQCRAGSFQNPGGEALSAEQASIEGHMYLDDRALVVGTVDLAAARITRGLSLRSPDSRTTCVLRLDLAHVGTIRDDSRGWPIEGKLRLYGFTYDSIDQESPHDAKSRIRWIRRQYPPSRRFSDHCRSVVAGVYLGIALLQHKQLAAGARLRAVFMWYVSWTTQALIKLDCRLRCKRYPPTDKPQPDYFSPQPYEQLARVLLNEGHEQEAKKIQIKKNWDYLWWRQRIGFWQKLRLDWIWRGLFGAIIGFGYKPWRALLWIGGFVALGLFFFSYAFSVGGMKQTKEWGVSEKRTAVVEDKANNGQTGADEEGDVKNVKPVNPPKERAPWSAFLYSLDSFVPLANLHHAEYWQPDPEVCPGVNAYLCVHIVAGWALTALFAVGLTGKVRT